ncbi:hypothetical protein [Micromonospora sp. CB01531]|uniref:hypothetical protein n=1 Tax=Micromonospora sp. CB01531 TaxID=1718947 RepID=UPI00093B65EE|nr:hypothetical protein [Micromonospora sp. CB01531]OKI47256.1 hypothetical protein A6A27_10430 [Micromonospora sp. CB01531]
MQHCKTRSSNILLACAVAVFIVAGVLAFVDGHVSGRAFAAGLVGLGVATAALAANTRAVGAGLEVSVARAPRAEYHRGYGDCAEDMFRGALDDPGEDPDGRNP